MSISIEINLHRIAPLRMILKQRKLLEVKGDRVRFQFLSVLGPIRVHILRSRNIYSLVQGPLKQMDGIALNGPGIM